MLWRSITFVVVIVSSLIILLVLINSRYRTIKQNYQSLKQNYHTQLEAVKLQQAKIDTLYKLDIKHTKELKHAKGEIDKLHDAVSAGNKRLHFKAVCRTPETSTTKSRHDESTPQLSEAARQDYFRLREMIVENEKQTEYLQQYIKTQFKS